MPPRKPGLCTHALRYISHTMSLLLEREVDAVTAQVSPNSAVYFYEFTSSSSTEKYWTTRFAITDENGGSLPPTEPTQPNGDKIPWGTGTLVSDSGSLPGSSSSGLPPPLPSSSSSLPDGSSSIFSSSSRLSSTRTPVPTQTSVTGNSQSSSNGNMAVIVPKALLAFVVGLATASTAFFL